MKKLFLATMATLMLGIVVVAPKAMAASCGSASQCISGGLNAAGANTSAGSLSDVLSTVTSVLMFLIGAVSVIMIIVGGFRYTTSQGDQAKLQTAKNTVMYSVIGLAIAIFGYAIISFVISSFIG